jgi:Ser/Thr protein kinase RdoA (MazF antagonist)
MDAPIKQIIQNFLPHQNYQSETISNGLINSTFKIFSGGTTEAFILQKINAHIFPQPALLQQNYRYISAQLTAANSRFKLPKIIPPLNGAGFLSFAKNNSWRMFQYIPNSYTPAQVQTAEQAHEVALSFSRLTLDLAAADSDKVHAVIPNFHNLVFRHQQLLDAIKNNSARRLQEAKRVLEGLEAYKPLLLFYEKLPAANRAFRKYILHHDAKISNILFDKMNNKVITPIDMDTTMPGYFFSDAGDMIRSMAGSTDENDTVYSNIHINRDNYEAITDGYLTNMSKLFSKEENNFFHLSGLLLVYMQCLRFVADYINGDIYYQTTHPQQNLYRATNQLTLLQQLAFFVKEEYRQAI